MAKGKMDFGNWSVTAGDAVGRPTWRNDASVTGPMRSYPTGVRLINDGQTLRVAPSTWETWFTAIFTITFAGMMAVAGWSTPDSDSKLMVGVGFPLLVLIAGAAIFAFLHWEKRRGDYLVCDRIQQTVTLPRVKKTFSRSQIAGLQWITGRSRDGGEEQSDLNLLVNENGSVVRYFVIGDPDQQVVIKIHAFMAVHQELVVLHEQRGYRDDDMDTYTEA